MVSRKDIFAEDDALYLRNFTEEDADIYFRIMQEDSFVPSPPMDRPDYLKIMLDDFLNDKRFYCIAIRKKDGMPIGYCGINDVRKKEWEIAVMLLADYQRQGYGRRMTTLLIKRLTEMTGRKDYYALVEPKNKSSHLLFRSMGFKPAGVFKLVDGMPENFYRDVENDNLDKIDDWLCHLAKQFRVEPRALLSHMTRYKSL